jgi:hypothetical protein
MTQKRFSTQSRAAQIAAQIKAAEEEQKAYDAAIDDALKTAGRARVEFVEKLYEFFDIDPEMTPRRDKATGEVITKDGEPVLVRTDRKEERRIERLARAFEAFVNREEATSQGNDEGRRFVSESSIVD